jgi:hypothetical protein
MALEAAKLYSNAPAEKKKTAEEMLDLFWSNPEAKESLLDEL